MNTLSLRKKPSSLLVFGIAGLLVIFTIGSIAVGSKAAWMPHQDSLAGQQIRQFAPSTAQVQELRGRVEVRLQDGQWRIAQAGDLLAAGERIRTGDLSSVALAFYDGSRARLGANSELSIEALDAQDSSQKRSIDLYQWSGESTHTVAKNGQQGSVYAVRSPDGIGEAMGTEFRVLVMPDAKTLYFVLEGVVSVTSLQVTVIVNPGEYTTVLPEQPPSNPFPYMTVEGIVTQLGDTWIVDGQPYQVNDQTVIVGSIQVGDWVHVDAHLLEDGSRVADFVLFLHSSTLNHFTLTGTVEAIGEKEWTVNGQTIQIEGATIEPGIAVNDQVKVDGAIQEDGSFLALTIARQEPVLGTPFMFTGSVQAKDVTVWVVSGISVNVTTGTIIDPGLGVGDLVKVEGWIEPNGLWTASAIHHATAQENQFEFTGALVSMDPWQVGGIDFETREWTVIDAGLLVGDVVRVTGEIDPDGIWIATTVEKVEGEEPASIVLVGVVLSMDPWVVSGVQLNVTTETVIEGEIQVGIMVRVEISPQPDGSWVILKIQPLQNLPEFTGCMDIIATVLSFDGSQIQLENWPALSLSPDVQIEGELAANTVVRMHVCFTQEATIQIVLIVVMEQDDPETPPDMDRKVFVCHKPDKKKGGHTLNISINALPAHLGHGDYEGPCR